MRDLLNITIILCVYLNVGCIEGAQERESVKVDSHTIQVNSLWPSSSSCIPSSKGSLDYGETLKQDQARIDFIHSKSSKNFANRLRQSQSTDLPVKDESRNSARGSGNYLVTIGIGTPKQDQSMIIDTGSDLTWTKCGRFNTNSCKYCKSRQYCPKSCKSTKKHIFNPSSSKSFQNIMSSSPVCSNLDSAEIRRACSAPSCCYGITYGDKSSTTGFLAKEKFTLSDSDVFDEDDIGIPNKTDGLLGLGRHNLSFPSQTATTYNNIFSYCLPSSARYTGHPTFGSTGIFESVKYTPIISFKNYENLYGLDLVGITVGGKKLEIPTSVFSEPGFIIDSGTVITRLPPKAYAALRSAFKEQMMNYTTIQRRLDGIMDTCYHSDVFKKIATPKVAFSFGGETTVEIDSRGILYPVKDSYRCLAFAANKDDTEVAIFGSVQQMTLQVVYDNAGRHIGFAPNGCS